MLIAGAAVCRMAIWAISASPLIMGNDMRNVTEESAAISEWAPTALFTMLLLSLARLFHCALTAKMCTPSPPQSRTRTQSQSRRTLSARWAFASPRPVPPRRSGSGLWPTGKHTSTVQFVMSLGHGLGILLHACVLTYSYDSVL